MLNNEANTVVSELLTLKSFVIQYYSDKAQDIKSFMNASGVTYDNILNSDGTLSEVANNAIVTFIDQETMVIRNALAEEGVHISLTSDTMSRVIQQALENNLSFILSIEDPQEIISDLDETSEIADSNEAAPVDDLSVLQTFVVEYYADQLPAIREYMAASGLTVDNIVEDGHLSDLMMKTMNEFAEQQAPVIQYALYEKGLSLHTDIDTIAQVLQYALAQNLAVVIMEDAQAEDVAVNTATDETLFIDTNSPLVEDIAEIVTLA